MKNGKRSRLIIGATAVVLAGGAVAFLGATDDTARPFYPVPISEPTPANSRARDTGNLPTEAPAAEGLYDISPTSQIGQALGANLQPGYRIDNVRANRFQVGGALRGWDRAMVVGPAGDRYLVTHFLAFSTAEMAGAGFAQETTPQGTYWVTSDEPDMQSVTFLSTNGVGIRVDHLSASADNRVAPPALRAMAARMSAGLRPSDAIN